MFRQDGEEERKRLRLLDRKGREAVETKIAAAEANTKDGSDDDVLLLDERGLRRWTTALAMSRAVRSPEFAKVAQVIWERSPINRGSHSFLPALMHSWGRANKELQTDAVEFFTKAGRLENLQSDQKRRLLDFAGEESLLNSP